ncbi:uncharacterized protein TNCT_13101 [Trichonephila clavata]|uniref:Uncharacterized protein n=1 Tax=Trichonephila clavata TaxID=2740835 RepID=A0A8X6LLE5_TRICU|nr:uncharacterized protein TNCT_13101 [Trichonephila clavata]
MFVADCATDSRWSCFSQPDLGAFQACAKQPERGCEIQGAAAKPNLTPTLENINISREFSIDRPRANRALKWLVAENELYKDVVMDKQSRIEESDYVRVQLAAAVQEQEEREIEIHQRGNVYMPVNDISRIIRAPWYQSNETIVCIR